LCLNVRTPGEILFRLRQEVMNAYLLMAKPAPPDRDVPLKKCFPELPAGFEPSPLASDILARVAAAGGEIDWRRDYVHGRSSGLEYFRRIPYLDFAKVGDHKNVWELNRHQQLVVLAQAGEWAEIERQLESWWAANPFQRGINWASALEVAFRALSWMWVDHLTPAMPAAFRRRFLTELYRHGLHLEYNLSIYFSPNTHLLGEVVALHALGCAYPDFPNAARWRALGRRWVVNEVGRQFREDGSHFEQSSYYHGYAYDMLRFHDAIEALPDRGRLEKIAEYWDAVRDFGLGDEDGGMFVRGREAPRGPGGPPHNYRTKLFRESGVVVMAAGGIQVVVDAGAFGPGNAGHSHSDTLAILARRGDREVLIDAGTFTYVADPEARDWFRGSAAHNTVRVDGRDQATPAGPFRWVDPPSVIVHEWNPDTNYLDVSCTSGDVSHRRRVQFVVPDLLLVIDRVDGPSGEHDVEQFWHIASEADAVRIHSSHPAEPGRVWRSRVYGQREPAPVLRAHRRTTLPVTLTTAIDLSESGRKHEGRAQFPWPDGDAQIPLRGDQ
jgi:hypothetical protein